MFSFTLHFELHEILSNYYFCINYTDEIALINQINYLFILLSSEMSMLKVGQFPNPKLIDY